MISIEISSSSEDSLGARRIVRGLNASQYGCYCIEHMHHMPRTFDHMWINHFSNKQSVSKLFPVHFLIIKLSGKS